MKRCSKCKTCQSAENFYKSAKAKDGLHSWCRDCHRAKPKGRTKAIFAPRPCVVCGGMWAPISHAQDQRNLTCGIACRGQLIAERRGRTDDEVRVIIAANTTSGETGCVEWRGEKCKGGYGRITVRGHKHMAHRIAYEFAKGAIPAGMQIDHLCRNTCCVNPDHLEPVTQRENLRRQWAARKAEVRL